MKEVNAASLVGKIDWQESMLERCGFRDPYSRTCLADFDFVFKIFRQQEVANFFH